MDVIERSSSGVDCLLLIEPLNYKQLSSHVSYMTIASVGIWISSECGTRCSEQPRLSFHFVLVIVISRVSS